MFGLKRRHRPVAAPVTTTQTVHTTRSPHTSGGLMSRLRPRRRAPVAVTTTTRAPRTRRTFGRKTRARGVRHHHAATTTTTAVPARRTSIGDKLSGAMLRIRGSLSGRPGVKAAGTRRMRGTDGRAPRRYY